MTITRPRQPDATEHNMHDFISTWMFNNGGTRNNAFRMWEVELHKNLSRDLSKPYNGRSAVTGES